MKIKNLRLKTGLKGIRGTLYDKIQMSKYKCQMIKKQYSFLLFEP